MDKLNEALQILIDLLKSTKDFVGDQAPKVAQEIVQYSFYHSLVLFVFFSLMVLGAIFSAILIYRGVKKAGDSDAYCLLMFPLALGSVFLYQVVSSGNAMIKAKVAPRVVILDYLQEKLSNRK